MVHILINITNSSILAFNSKIIIQYSHIHIKYISSTLRFLVSKYNLASITSEHLKHFKKKKCYFMIQSTDGTSSTSLLRTHN